MTITAPPPPPAIVSPEQVPPEQRRPPARSNESIFSQYPLLAFQPACSQLIPQNGGGGVTWVVEMPDGTMNPLAITEPMEQPRAFAAMDASGICKTGGAVVPIMTLQELQMRQEVLQVNPLIDPTAVSSDTNSPPWVRMGLLTVAGAIAAYVGLAIYTEQSNPKPRQSSELAKLLGGDNHG